MWRVYDQSPVHYLMLKRQLKSLLFSIYDYKQNESKKEINIVLILRDGTTYPKSSAFIRLIAPLTENQTKKKISFRIFGENTTALPDDTDVCIVQRTAFDNKILAEQLLINIKNINAKLIIDNDDAFSAIDESHIEHSMQGNSYEALDYLIKNADQIWVSTKQLSKLLPKTKGQVHVITNGLDERIWKKSSNLKNILKTKPVQLVYMGTATHDADLEMIMPALDRIAVKYPNSFELNVIGVASGDIEYKDWINRIYQPRGHSIYPRFVKWFLKQGPFDFGLCPLVESPFNNCKSDIKCLDYIAAGILPIASDVPAYTDHELDSFIIRSKNTTSAWEETLENLLKKDGLESWLNRKIYNAQNYLWAKRSSAMTAKKLLALIEELQK